MRTGRPSKYKPEYVEAVGKYLETCGSEKKKLPTVAGLAVYLGVWVDKIYRWSEKHPDFRKSVKEMMAVQAQQLQDDTLYNGANALIGRLLLSHNHGMSETQKTDITSKGEKIIPILANVSSNNSHQETDGSEEED